jgi:hypothetical protein
MSGRQNFSMLTGSRTSDFVVTNQVSGSSDGEKMPQYSRGILPLNSPFHCPLLFKHGDVYNERCKENVLRQKLSMLEAHYNFE